MKILMIAPEPCFIARGTPMSVLARCRALTELGHTVDLVTYPVGNDVPLEGLTIVRAAGLPGVKRVKAGPSLLKMILDVPLYCRARRLARRGGYDCVHTHEEASLQGALLRKRCGGRHVYDMHSSLPEQLGNYGWFSRGPVVWIAKALERWVLKRTDLVICICQKLAEGVGDLAPTVVIHNAPLPEDTAPPAAPAEPVALYLGNFGNNQGLDLLVDSIPLVRERRSDVQFVLAGGEGRQIARLKAKLGDGNGVRFVPRIEPGEASRLLSEAAVLLSPRPGGENVPLKIYHYLHAGKPIVATDIPAHTQVLNRNTAVLTEPTPAAFAEGIVRVVEDEKLATDLADNAGRLAATNYSYSTYRENVREAYSRLKT
jgi:glycosyltransferase involved in cell wall biosynthesis